MKQHFFAFSVVLLLLMVLVSSRSFGELGAKLNWRALLSLAWPEKVAVADLKTKYETSKLRILIVPGHDNDYTGAMFAPAAGDQASFTENDLTLATARALDYYFRSNPCFEVFATRDFITGEYLPEFATYFTEQREEILAFRQKLLEQFTALVSTAEVTEEVLVEHNFAPPEVGLRLFGFNKWANEHEIDLVIHLHFNDYPGHKSGRAGKHSGFAVYIPERQYPNAKVSAVVGQAIFQELKQFLPVSSLPLENVGLVEDQELIAIGSRGSRDGASLLVEYGYIYEQQFVNPAVRAKILPELAWGTYRAVENYFAKLAGESASLTGAYPTTLLPHHFTENLFEGITGQAETLVLQRALKQADLYPPPGRNLTDCPLNGNFGPCTKHAVTAFQNKYGITPTSGVMGELTRAKLNELFSSGQNNGLK